MPVSTSSFNFHGHRLVYDEYGSGDRVVVLIPGARQRIARLRPRIHAAARGGDVGRPSRACARAGRELRRNMDQRTLVIGHERDPIHPFSDPDMLVREMPNARLVQASSILELRLTAAPVDGRNRIVHAGLLPRQATRARTPATPVCCP